MKCIHYGSNGFESNLFKPVTNMKFAWNKPEPGTGLWASPVNSKYGWKQWCIDNDFETNSLLKSFTFSLKGRILKIRDTQCLKELPIIQNSAIPRIVGLDFEKISNDYDAIYLTLEGLYSNNGCFTYPNLYGWDCESVLVLNKNAINL